MTKPTRKARSVRSEYKAWQHMKERCLNKNNPRFKDYGGRGISIHKIWITSFKTFYEHIGHKPASDYSLDRIDNDGNYEPGNVRWATKEQQRKNKRSKSTRNESILLAARKGETFSSIGERYGITHQTISNVVNKLSPGEFIFRGEGHRNTHITWDDVEKIRNLRKTETQRRLARMFGVSQAAIWSIIHEHTWNRSKNPSTED